MNHQKSVKISLLLTYIFIILLIAIVIALPWLVSWYVEIKGRSASLPATIMVTCYPCAPFVAAALLSLRKLLKNILDNQIFVESNSKQLKRISLCSLIIAVITLIAGRFYLPFYIVCGTFAFLSLLIFSFHNAFVASNIIKTENSNNADNQNK